MSPGMILGQCINFIAHCIAPVRDGECLSKPGEFSVESNCCDKSLIASGKFFFRNVMCNRIGTYT